jgi:MYXO-CTERM domain-containing protein
MRLLQDRSLRHVIACVCVAVAMLATAAQALADGDPASDVLPLQDVYLPYSPQVSPPVASALRKLLKETRAAGYPVKVAVIATPTDLGAVPDLFGQAQRYAAFLGNEISFNSHDTLLVVMPSGYGAVNLPPSATAALQGVAAPSGSNADTLAKAAIAAVVRLARSAGHPVAAPKISGGSSGGGTSPAVVFGAPVALLALAGLLMTIRRRTAPPGEAVAEPGPAEAPERQPQQEV